MKILITILLVISFINIVVFGVFGMHTGMQNHSDNCIAAAVQRTDCPRQNNLFNFLFFHLNAFKNFLTVIFSEFAFSLLIYYLLVIGIAIRILLGNSGLLRFNFSRYKLRRLELFSSLFRYKFFYWLALHENSPTAS